MLTRRRDLQVSLLCDPPIGVTSHQVSVLFRRCAVTIGSSPNPDILITNLTAAAISESTALSEFRGAVVIVLREPDRAQENEYQELFLRATILTFRYEHHFDSQTAQPLVDSEVVKHLVRNGRVGGSAQLFSRHTRRELLGQLGRVGILLIPFMAIMLYFIAKYVVHECGGHVSFLCWFVYYEPDCMNNTARELLLFALLYAMLNLWFYYSYVLEVLERVRGDVFECGTLRRAVDTSLKWIVPALMFISGVIILKSLFVFKYSTRIAEENLFINIGRILDGRLEFLRDDLLIYYFLSIDLCLWAIARNFTSVKLERLTRSVSYSQCNLIDDARREFLQSVIVDVVVIVFSIAVLRSVFDTPQSIRGAQLIFLQCIYLIVNVNTAFRAFSFR